MERRFFLKASLMTVSGVLARRFGLRDAFAEESKKNTIDHFPLYIGARTAEEWPSLTFTFVPFYGEIYLVRKFAANGEIAYGTSRWVISTKVTRGLGNDPDFAKLKDEPETVNHSWHIGGLENGNDVLAQLNDFAGQKNRNAALLLPCPLVVSDEGDNIYENFSCIINEYFFSYGSNRNEFGAYIPELWLSPYERVDDHNDITKDRLVFDFSARSELSAFSHLKNEAIKMDYTEILRKFFKENDCSLLEKNVEKFVNWLATFNESTSKLELDLDIVDIILEQIRLTKHKNVLQSFLDNLKLIEPHGIIAEDSPLNSLGGMVEVPKYGLNSAFFCKGPEFVLNCILARKKFDRSVVTYPLAFNKKEWKSKFLNLKVKWREEVRIAESGNLNDENFVDGRIEMGKMIIPNCQFIVVPNEDNSEIEVWINDASHLSSYEQMMELIFDKHPNATVYLPDQGDMNLMILSDGENCRPFGNNAKEEENMSDKDALQLHRENGDLLYSFTRRRIIPYAATNRLSIILFFFFSFTYLL